MARRNRALEARIIDALRAWPAGDRPTMKSLARAVNQPHMLLVETIRSMRYGGMIDWLRLELSPSMAAANDGWSKRTPAASACAGDQPADELIETPPAEPALAIPPAPISGGSGQAGDVDLAVTASPASPAIDAAPSPLAEQVKAEAAAASARRQDALNRATHRSTGLSIGAQVQLERLSDGPGAGVAVLREAWPETMHLLGRLSAATGERPIPLIVRLIHDAARKAGLRIPSEAKGELPQ